jgi:hypothetical protein
MQAIRQIISPCSENLSLRLPKEFLNKKIEVIIFPYTEDKEPADREERLLKIYNESEGILPDNYKFDREEAHER